MSYSWSFTSVFFHLYKNWLFQFKRKMIYDVAKNSHYSYFKWYLVKMPQGCNEIHYLQWEEESPEWGGGGLRKSDGDIWYCMTTLCFKDELKSWINQVNFKGWTCFCIRVISLWPSTSIRNMVGKRLIDIQPCRD